MDDADPRANPAVPRFGPSLGIFEAAVEAVLDAVIITSPDLDLPGPTIEYVNPAFTSMTGYTARDVLGKSPRLLQGPATDRAVLARLRLDLGSGRGFRGSAVNYRKDGHSYLVEWLVSPIHDEAGRIAHWVAVQRDITRREQMEANQLSLLAELQHRVRNVLAIVQSIARETGKTSRSVEGFSAHLEGRIASLSRTQVLLTTGGETDASLKDLIRSELKAQNIPSRQYHIEGPSLRLSAKVAEIFAMAVHELTTNAVKFGAFSEPSGRVTVQWSVDHGQQPPCVHLDWTESGDLSNVEPTPLKGFGSKLIEGQAAYELGGKGKIEFRSEGVQCTLDLPLVERSSVLETSASGQGTQAG